MGLLDWFRKSGPEPVGGYGQFVELFNGVAARSGVTVNARTALECSAVLACVRVIANGLAQVPFKLYRAEGRNRNPAVGHGLYELMDMAPNEFQTAFEFRHMLALHLCLTGNAYIWLNRVGGRIVEMLPYPPGCVSIERDGWELTYRITTQDKRYITVPRKDMWHVRWLSWDGVSGLDGVVLAREAIGLSLALETYGASSFRNGVRPSGILSTDQGLNKDQRKDLRTAWEAAFAGTENAERAAVLGSGMKWTQLSMPNDAAQFIESRQYQVEEVCRAFGQGQHLRQRGTDVFAACRPHVGALVRLPRKERVPVAPERSGATGRLLFQVQRQRPHARGGEGSGRVLHAAVRRGGVVPQRHPGA